MKPFTKEQKKEYFANLREQWKVAKQSADIDEIKAIIQNHGLNISPFSFAFVSMQMKALGFDGLPYLDCKIFQGWKENGFIVKKGEKSKIDGLTWLHPTHKETNETGKIEKTENTDYLFPKVYHLFHRSQTEPII
jgi:hypothetical protein